MAITITTAKRKFKTSELTLDDPNPSFSIEEVRKFYSSRYPELTNASISGPEMINDEAVYTFGKNIGTKG